MALVATAAETGSLPLGQILIPPILAVCPFNAWLASGLIGIMGSVWPCVRLPWYSCSLPQP